MTSIAPLSLTERFRLILGGISRAVAAKGGRDHAAGPLVILICNRLNRIVTRLLALAAQVAAGTLRAPRVACRRRETAATPREPPRLRLPRGFGWLIREVRETVQYGGQVSHILDDPEMLALLAAAPQAGRILRPLCRMMAISLPEQLRRPARPPPRRKSRPRATKPPAVPSKAPTVRASTKWPRMRSAQWPPGAG